VSKGLYQALAPHVTVLGQANVNAAHASEPVLASLSGATPALVRQLMVWRQTGGTRPSLASAETFVTDEEGPAYTIETIGRTPSGIEARVTTVVMTRGVNFATNRVTVLVVEQR
jgi:hypothetical protein